MNKNPIYLSSWSIRDKLRSGELQLNQLANFARDNNFQGVEFIDRHFDNLSTNYLQSLIKSLKKAKLCATLGLTTDFAISDAGIIEKQIDYVKSMLNLAAEMEAKSVRILLGGSDSFLQKAMKQILALKKDKSFLDSIKKQKKVISLIQRTIFFKWLHAITIKNKRPRQFNFEIKNNIKKALDSILPEAQKKSIPLAIENHWGVTALAENILEIIHFYDSAFLGTCPDFGNFTIHQNRYTELKKLMPFAKEVHAKSYKFNKEGEETAIDYEQCISIIRQSNFSGPLIVEYEGTANMLKNSLKTRDLILRYL